MAANNENDESPVELLTAGIAYEMMRVVSGQ